MDPLGAGPEETVRGVLQEDVQQEPAGLTADISFQKSR